MSRILNRPMFRGGGKVSSYGKGIASGLTSKPKRGLVDEPGGYAGEQFLISPEMFREFNETRGSTGSGSTTGQTVVQKAKDKVKSAAGKSKNFFSKLIPQGKNLESRIIKGGKNLYNLLPKEGLLSKGVKQFPKLTKIAKPTGILTAAVSGPSIIGESNRPKTYAALEYMKSMNQSGVFDETAGPGDYEAFTEEFDRLNDVTKYTPIPDERGFFNKYINPMGFVMGLNPEDKTAEEINKIIEGDTEKNNPNKNKLLKPEDGSLIPGQPKELTMKEQVAKDKELFAELLGEGEARGKDVSDMLLRFAGSGGNTVGEKFQQYIGAEAMAGPSRTEKINQAAASLAINDYIAGKRSKENMEMMIAKTEKNVDYTIQKQKERDAIKGKDFVEAVGMEATAQKKNVGDTNVIATVLYKQTGKAPKIVSDYANKNYGADVDIDVEKLITGLNIVTFKDRKIVIEKDPSGNLREATEYPI